MLLRNRTPVHHVVALSLFVPLAGCAHETWLLPDDTNVVDLQYKPDREKTSPLGRLPRLKIALEVRDRRVVSEQDRVGNGETWHDTLLKHRILPAKVISQDPVVILTTAMTYALRDNGHTVVQARDLTAGVIIQAHLKMFMSNIIEREDLGPLLESAFAMDIEVLTKPDDNRILSKPIRTTYRRVCSVFTSMTNFYTMVNCYAETLNEGFARFIQSFSADPEVLEALRSAFPKTGT